MCDTDHDFDRREFLRLGAAAGAGVLLGSAGLPGLALSAGTSARRKTLIWIYAGGGNDGLHMFPKYGDAKFATYRPDLIGAPNSGPNAALALAGSTMWGLNPNMASLQEIWAQNRLAISMATAVPEGNGSHFWNEARLFRGGETAIGGGLLARYLSLKTVTDPMAAIRAGATDLPAILSGGTVPAVSVAEAAGFDLQVADWCQGTSCSDNRLTQQLARLGAAAPVPAVTLNSKVRVTQKTLVDSFSRVRNAASSYVAEGGAVYSLAPVGKGLRTVAQLLKADVPVEVAFVNWTGPFDRHVDLVEAGGVRFDPAKPANQYFGYAQALKTGADDMLAFYKDMGTRMDDIVVIISTEFGRRVGVNGTAGVDHGFGGAWFMFGGPVKGGIYGDPGALATVVGSGSADGASLPMAMNYKNMVGEIMAKHMKLDQAGISTLFPGHAYSDPGMLNAATA
jgi:uncharacterized protein (DUF1501 family)